MKLSDIKNIGDLKLWLATWSTQSNDWWVEQRTWNDRMYNRVDDLRKRVFSIERRNSWIAGASSVIGSVLGSGITVFIVLKFMGLNE